MPLTAPRCDAGSWSAVWNLMAKDEAGNVAHGNGKVMLADTKGSYAYSDHGCLALVGVENIVVVMTEDAVLVASKEHAESVKSVVEQIRANGEAQALHHNRVYPHGAGTRSSTEAIATRSNASW